MTTSHAQDVFMGTIVQKDQNFYFQHCNINADEYLIQSKNPEIFKQLRQLSQDYPMFWLSLLATPDGDAKDLTLYVDEILDIHPNRSCHLHQMDDLSQLDTTEN